MTRRPTQIPPLAAMFLPVICAVAMASGAAEVRIDHLLDLDPSLSHVGLVRLSAGLEEAPEAPNPLRLANATRHNDFRLDPPDGEPLQFSEPQIAPAASAPVGGAEGLAKKLANPISDLISIPIQFNYDEGFGPKDAGRMTVNVQPVIPFSISEDWNLVTRTIVPIIYQDSIAEGFDSEFGLGDVLQSFFFSPKDPVGGWIVGAGPAVLWPTGTNPALRSENLALGPTAVALRQDGGWTYGALANHLWSITHSDDREQVNATYVQPFLGYTWPTATTLLANVEASYDWNTNDWNVPANLLVSQVVKLGSQPVQLQLGGRYYAESPEGGAEWGLRFTITFLFPK